MIFQENPTDIFTVITSDLIIPDFVIDANNIGIIIPFGNFNSMTSSELEIYGCYKLDMPSTPDGKTLSSYSVARVSGIVQIIPVWVDAPVNIPQSVTRAQAKIALSRAGLLSQVTQAVSTNEEAQIWFNDALTWTRDNPYVASMSALLGLTSQQVDQLFITANNILV